jgi:hypothetical protein
MDAANIAQEGRAVILDKADWPCWGAELPFDFPRPAGYPDHIFGFRIVWRETVEITTITKKEVYTV